MKGLELIKNRNLLKNSGYINGYFTNGTAISKFPVINPSNGSIITELPSMTAVDASVACDSAYDAWKQWRYLPAKNRGIHLKKMADLMKTYQNDIAAIMTLECGKPFNEAKGELNYATSFYDYCAEECKRIKGETLESPTRGNRIVTIKQSVGPAALITPWNFPAAMITRKVGPALAAGCSVVIKPAAETPLTALALCAIAEEAGIPPGVVNCLTVENTHVTDVGKTLCHSEKIRKLSFTGSTNVGKWLMRESSHNVKKISLELGGNAPFIVFDDADLEVALGALMTSKFRNAGQACIASNRVYVQDGVYDKFASMVVAAASKLRVGDGFGDGISIGPLINKKALDKVKAQVDDCIGKGAMLLIGGKENSNLNEQGGSFFQPTVLTNCSSNMLPFHEETFGPIIPMVRFSTEEDAIQLANNTPFGLAAYACTRDLGRAWRISEELESGMVGINEGAISYDIVPFGGVKESGIGREGGSYGIEEYQEIKYINMGLGRK